MVLSIKPCQKAGGTITLPGDKSISHRALIISSIAHGTTHIKNILLSDDCRVTLLAMRSLGVVIKKITNTNLIVEGVGRFGLRKPSGTIDVGESGTSMRILAGLLCAQPFATKLAGKTALRNRPMARVIVPLRKMGAHIAARKRGPEEYPPISIMPVDTLRPITWKMKIASAQVKSAVALAGLYAAGPTTIYEPVASRDHTERMLRSFGAKISKRGRRISIYPSELTSVGILRIPGDISSAAFFIVLASLLKNSRIRLRNVCLNPTRAGVLEVLSVMGARIRIVNKQCRSYEPVGDIIVESSSLKAVHVREVRVPRIIDELPILMVAASLAKGTSVFEGVGELRVKETDRINSMAQNLKSMGVRIETKRKANKEVIAIRGSKFLTGAKLKSYADHRTAMSMIIAGLCARSASSIDEVGCIKKSFPGFLEILKHLVIS